MLITTHNTNKRTNRLFHDHVYKFLGISKVIPSDMDVRFTSRFWKLLHSFSEAMFAVSTTSSKRVNRVIEDMLRHRVNLLHDD